MRRGVTLLELAIVLGIVAILMGLSVASLQAVRTRASYGSTSSEVIGAVKRARIEAINRGRYTAFILDRSGSGPNGLHRYWTIQTTNAFSLTTFSGNPAACNTPPSCEILTSGTLPAGIAFGPDNYGAALPAPMGSIALANSSACSFCATSPSNWGSILFSPGGAAAFSAAPAGIGQQFTIVGTRDTNVARVKAVAVVARTGLIEAFDKP